MRIAFFIITILLFNATVFAQPYEKLHLHTDKDVYLPGETIWFKGYVFQDNLPSRLSTNFYVSLYDEYGNLLQKKCYPIANNTIQGNFDLPDTLNANRLICKAYTSWMLNYEESFFFTKILNCVSGPDFLNTQKVKSHDLKLTVFPEGGNILADVKNTVAIKVSYSNGMPYNAKCSLYKKGDVQFLQEIVLTHDGMGKFDYDQTGMDEYYIKWEDDSNKTRVTQLPQPQLNGVSLKVAQIKDRIVYNVINKTGYNGLYVTAQIQQYVIYNKPLNTKVNSFETDAFFTNGLPTGIMTITVFDSLHREMAERVVFINKQPLQAFAQIVSKNVSFDKKAKNDLEIVIQDTIPCSLSISVTDADVTQFSDKNIYSSLLLCGDIKGYVHNPNYYFTDTALEAVPALDLVMLTNGWRKYSQHEKYLRPDGLAKEPNNFITVTAFADKNVKAQIGENLSVIIKDKTLGSQYFNLITTDGFSFELKNAIFYDTALIYYGFKNKKELNAKISFEKNVFDGYFYNETLDKNLALKNLQPVFYDTGTSGFNSVKQLLFAKSSITKIKTLDDVIVKSKPTRNWQNSPMLKLDEKYTTGYFRGGLSNSFAFDVLNDPQAFAKGDIYNYLAYKVPGGMKFLNGPLGKEFGSLIFIDEFLSDNNALQSISIDQIAYVKVIPRFVGSGAEPGLTALRGAIAVYLKKDGDVRKQDDNFAGMPHFSISGYSSVKEFYQPDYAEMINREKNDYRTTLYWNAYCEDNLKEGKIPLMFYNNDFTKRFRIVLEGINEEGRLVHIEKIIE